MKPVIMWAVVGPGDGVLLVCHTRQAALRTSKSWKQKRGQDYRVVKVEVREVDNA